ncbi:MAG: hypothetical protein A2784_01195 [Candidatus Chisholmbacteria bacterium RIFCSPHIGHO2_01_FULL_48_12]|uniref:Uncharacterized protein n=1 Tax=Candidatus Chisholmbacteria bacterium RIFCSPHIGHO2_01_FULL_48_12 TaxID=1797589 RepID=A0A1G1VQP9_9BACT|nr:MAG: hypothetical protein A2784_01195 [Candidatus Chisholmbacteria bacterium RIFCSPHIGHO2_01_FULL_48_12]
MLAASHALFGAAIATAAPTPAAGFIIALLSHPLLDFVPHWDLHTRYTHRSRLKLIALSLTDATLGILPGIWLFGHLVPLPILIATMLIAQAPDWLEAPYHLLQWHFPPFSTVKHLQHLWHHKLGLPWGLITQIAFLGALYVLAGPSIYSN